MSDRITLGLGEYELEGHLEEGGFGAVYAATAPDGSACVVKLVPKGDGTHRELLFIDELSGAPNVVPVRDRGEDDDHWALAMPRAEQSLRAHILEAGPRLGESEAIAIAIDVATALDGLREHGDVVHRDLKPENILLLDGAWCVADFGISRFAEATTATDTWKLAKTAPYAAPEQWREERATWATDIYSLGVLLFEILTGRRPFLGPDLRDEHLNLVAPPLESDSRVLAALVTSCLAKPPGSRPTPSSVLGQLRRAQQHDEAGGPGSEAEARLGGVNADVASERAVDEARESAERTERERHAELFAASEPILAPIIDELFTRAMEIAPEATEREAVGARGERSLHLGDGMLVFVVPFRLESSKERWGGSPPGFEVIAAANLSARQPGTERNQCEGRACSLWYCDAQEEGVYRWYETAFMISPMIARTTKLVPTAMNPGEEAGGALSRSMAEWQVAWPFTSIDQGEHNDFIERWLGYFATVATNQMQHPRNMPERDPKDSYRLA